MREQGRRQGGFLVARKPPCSYFVGGAHSAALLERAQCAFIRDHTISGLFRDTWNARCVGGL